MKTVDLYKRKLKSFFTDRLLDGLIGYLLYGKHFREMLSQRPFMLHLNLTNICNSDCSFCAYKYQSIPKQTMDFTLFKKLVDEYDEFGGGVVSLAPIIGEPLVVKNFLDYLKYLATKSSITGINIVTNGILIDIYGADVLLDYIHNWQISMSGFDEDMYKRMFRNNHYKRVRKNIIDLLDANSKRSNPRNIILTLRPDRPIKELMAFPDFKEVLKYNPTVHFTHKYSDFGGLISNKDFDFPVKFYGKRYKFGFKCDVAIRDMNVCPDGTVLTCSCFEAINYPEDLKIGNANSQSLLEIWKGHRRKEFLEKFSHFRLSLDVCRKCKTYRQEFFLYRKDVILEMKKNISRWKHGKK